MALFHKSRLPDFRLEFGHRFTSPVRLPNPQPQELGVVLRVGRHPLDAVMVLHARVPEVVVEQGQKSSRRRSFEIGLQV